MIIATRSQTKYFQYAMEDVQDEVPEFLPIVTKAFFAKRLSLDLAHKIISAHKRDDLVSIKRKIKELDV